MNIKNKKLWIVVLICSIVFPITFFLIIPHSSSSPFSEKIDYIRKHIRVVVVYDKDTNKTFYLDPNQWYCKYAVVYGGNNPFPWDLAYPGAQIAFFFLEDLNETLADNYSDTIIRMNPVNGTIENPDSGMKMCCVFFCEGGYDKYIHYKDQLLFYYHWTGDINTTKYYDIELIDLEGDC